MCSQTRNSCAKAFEKRSRSKNLKPKNSRVKEGQNQLDSTDHYQPLDHPMVVETASKVTSLIEDLYDGQFIDVTTIGCLLQTPKPPRVPEYYTLTRIHKPKPVGHPIISGCDGPTEKISAFVDKLIQTIAKIQNSYIKDTTDFIDFHKVTMDVLPNLYTNIPQEQVCKLYARHTTSFTKVTVLSQPDA